MNCVMKLNALLACLPLLLLFVIHGSHLATAQLEMNNFIQDLDRGPVETIICNARIPPSVGNPTVKWIFQDRTLAVNNMEADPSRYTVSYSYTRNIYHGRFNLKSILNIHNLVPEDEGVYKCQIDYTLNAPQTRVATVEVTGIPKYLPSLNYPKCTIEPTTAISAESNATFICRVGNSSPAVNLQLRLQRTDGSIIQIGEESYFGNSSVTTLVTQNDHNAVFTCHMTSDTFKSAYRNCSAGPITVSQIETLSTGTEATSSNNFNNTIQNKPGSNKLISCRNY